VSTQFQRDYELLELDRISDWKTARANYRRLVNVWHPDRYTDRPAEREHAQKIFIELTKSFNNLRNFHREKNRLPYQIDAINTSKPDELRPEQRVDSNVMQSSVLEQRQSSDIHNTVHRAKRTSLLIPTLLTIACGIGVFVYMDMSAKNRAAEEATRVLNTATPSEFLQDSGKIGAQNQRKSMVLGNGSKLIGN
jgi:hypothetical protein